LTEDDIRVRCGMPPSVPLTKFVDKATLFLEHAGAHPLEDPKDQNLFK
jgi:hypothetical protein